MQGVDAILSYRCPLLQSFIPQHTRLRIYRGGQTASGLLLSASPGVFVPTAFYGTGSPYNSGLPHPTLSALRVSTLSAAFRLPDPPGSFSPRNAPGILPSEPSLPEEPSRLSAPATLLSLSPRVFRGRRRSLLHPEERKDQATRLQGLAPFWSPFSRAWRLASAWGRCSLGLLPLQGFPHPL